MILAGDVGGTKTLLRMQGAEHGGIACEQRYASREFPDFGGLLRKFLAECRSSLKQPIAVERACFGVAGPVTGGSASLTNLSWRLDAASLAAEFGIGEVLLINDFAAAAYGVDSLHADEVATIQQGKPVADAPRLILGPGTGLGIAYLIRHSGEWVAVAGEAGHAAFAPRNDMELELLQHLMARRGRVEVEDVVSGRGLEAIHAFLGERASAAQDEKTEEPRDAAKIAETAKSGRDAIALAAVDLFLSALGGAAGDHALGILARGGVYISGGIAPKMLWRMSEGALMRAFTDRGRFSPISAEIPVHVVLNERLALRGAMLLARSERID